MSIISSPVSSTSNSTSSTISSISVIALYGISLTLVSDDITLNPGLDIVRYVSGFTILGSGNKPPENINWNININGIIVIAAVVFFTKDEMKRDNISEAYVISKNVMPISTINQGVITPGPSKLKPTRSNVITDTSDCKKHRNS